MTAICYLIVIEKTLTIKTTFSFEPFAGYVMDDSEERATLRTPAT